MSLGGYKFAGKYCEKGSLTDVQWALRMHKTKVAAFMAANALANAGWDYDMTGSPDGNYHCLDTVGNNYVTVFKRTNGENDYTWFAIYTLTKFTGTGTDSGAVKLYIQNNYSQMFFGYYACNFYRIGTTQIAYFDDLSTDPSSMMNLTGVMPVGNPGTSSSGISSSYYPPSNTSLVSVSSASFGYAIKGDSIVMLQGQGTGFSTSYLKCSVASGHAYSSFVNNETNGVFAYNTQHEIADASNYENATRSVSTLMYSPLCATANAAGAIKYNAKFFAVPFAKYSSSTESYPFQSIQVFDVANNLPATTGKGAVNVDLLAVNFPGMNQGLVPSVYSTFANGNYLVVREVNGYNLITFYPFNYGTTQQFNAALYVGWDPSNPDITQASSWQLYDGT